MLGLLLSRAGLSNIWHFWDVSNIWHSFLPWPRARAGKNFSPDRSPLKRRLDCTLKYSLIIFDYVLRVLLSNRKFVRNKSLYLTVRGHCRYDQRDHRWTCQWLYVSWLYVSWLYVAWLILAVRVLAVRGLAVCVLAVRVHYPGCMCPSCTCPGCMCPSCTCPSCTCPVLYVME